MSKCVYCHERKGKRACPALSGWICSPCCGEHRQTRIACPAACRYLDAGCDYQQKRSGERFAQARKEVYKELFAQGEDKAAALFNFIEAATFEYFCNRRDGQDAEVLDALQSLRRTLSPLHVPAAPASAFAEHLKKQYELFVAQQGRPETATATDVLDRALKFVTEFSGGGLQSNRFLHGLIGYIRAHHPQVAAQLAERSESSRIVLPHLFTPPPSETAPPPPRP
jgi:hypothetical protein